MTTADGCAASATYAGDANHTTSSDAKSITILKADPTIVVTPYSVIYDGAAHTATGTAKGVLDEDLVGLDLSGTTHTAAGAYAADPWTFTDVTGNYNDASGTVDDAIGLASSTTVVTCAAGPFTYNGSAQTPCSVSVTDAGGLNLTPAPVYADNTNAGTASASYTYTGDANHTGSADSKTFTIDKAPSSTTINCPTNVTYTGTALTPCSATATGAGGLSVSVPVVYGNNTNAGTATANATYAGDANHTGSTATQKTFTIDKAPSSTTINCPTNVTYTGTALTPCSATATGAGGLSVSVPVVYGNNTNAGTATANATYAGDANHTGSTATQKTFIIDKAPSSTTINCPTNVTYTGTALTPCSATATGAGGLSVSVPVVYGNNTNAGTATANATYAGDANHTGSTATQKTFIIDKAPSSTTINCPTNVTYTGTALTPCSATATGAGGLSVSVPVVYGNNTNAGTATANATYAGDANHTGSTATQKTFTIDKASSTTTVTCPTSVPYTGSALTPCSAVVTGAGGLNQSLTVSYRNNINVGTATASASYAGDVNHTSSSNSKNFAIAAWTLSGFFRPVDMGGVWNAVKNGSTVPLKFRIYAGGVEQTKVSAVKSLMYLQISCTALGASAADAPITTLATGGTVLRYTDSQFIFNWKTPSGAGKCYRVTMTAADGSTIQAYFKMK